MEIKLEDNQHQLHYIVYIHEIKDRGLILTFLADTENHRVIDIQITIFRTFEQKIQPQHGVNVHVQSKIT